MESAPLKSVYGIPKNRLCSLYRIVCIVFYFIHLSSPLEQKKVEVVVSLGKEIAQNSGGVSTADLIGRQAEVDTLDEVPELGHKILIKHPNGEREREGSKDM